MYFQAADEKLAAAKASVEQQLELMKEASLDIANTQLSLRTKLASKLS